MTKKRFIILILVFLLIFQTYMPLFNISYAILEEETETQESSEIQSDNIIEENQDNIENVVHDDEIVEDDTEEPEISEENETQESTISEDVNGEEIKENESEEKSENELIEDEDIIELNNEEIENDIIDEETGESVLEVTENLETGISVMSASGSGTGAGNENEFSNALYNTSVSELTISSVIRLTSSYTVNHNIRIDSLSSTGNSLQLSSGCTIIVPSGCVLTLDEVVIDGRTYGDLDGKACIVVQSGGVLMLTGHSIIDGGSKNWGISVESGGQLLVESARITNCYRGIVLQGTSYCDLASNTVIEWWGNTGKKVDITNNDTGIYCGGNYKGTLIVSHNSKNNENMNFESNTYGIFSETHSGSITISYARMAYNGWAIYTFGDITINNLNGAYNSRGIVNHGGSVNFNNGVFYADTSTIKEYGIYNISGTINMNGGCIYNNNVGIYNEGTVNMIAGTVSSNVNGVQNYNTFNMSGGSILENSSNGIKNEIYTSTAGQCYITGGTITGNSNYDIYHSKSDSDAAGAIYGGLRIEMSGTISSKIYLAAGDNYIYTGGNTPILSSITVASAYNGRKIIRSSTTNYSSSMSNNANVINKGSYYCKANATGYSNYVVLWSKYTITVQYKTTEDKILDTITKTYEYKDTYTTESKTFDGYVLSQIPSNSTGTTTGDILVVYYYEEKNIAIVKYDDNISGIISAKYWYNETENNFSGDGKDFENGDMFEDYGYYKVIVFNGVGIEKETYFVLNEESV